MATRSVGAALASTAIWVSLGYPLSALASDSLSLQVKWASVNGTPAKPGRPEIDVTLTPQCSAGFTGWLIRHAAQTAVLRVGDAVVNRLQVPPVKLGMRIGSWPITLDMGRDADAALLAEGLEHGWLSVSIQAEQ